MSSASLVGGDALVALVHELRDELVFQLVFGLIGGCGPRDLGHLCACGRGGPLEDEAVGRVGGAACESEVARQHAAPVLAWPEWGWWGRLRTAPP